MSGEAHGRLEWLLPEQLDESQESYRSWMLDGGRRPTVIVDETGRLVGPFNAHLLDPPVGRALVELATALRFATNLSDREREIVILSTAVRERCNFEWLSHARNARTVGMSETELDALAEGEIPATFTDRERLVLASVATLLEHDDLDDAAFASGAELGLPTLFDLVSLVGYYRMTALTLRVFRTPPLDGSVPVF